MKRCISLLILLISISSSIAAVPSVGVVPANGAFDIRLNATESYTLYSTNETPVHGSGSGTPSAGTYYDKQVIGIVGIWGRDASKIGDSAVSVSISSDTSALNGNFAFQSLANPTFVRPFEIQLVEIVSSANETRNFRSSINRNGEIVTPQISDEITENEYSVWYEILLVLPGTVSATGDLSGIPGDNSVYHLVTTDDYTANLTVTITDSDSGLSSTMLIPMSARYSPDSSSNTNSSASLSITVLPSAANLDIPTLASTQQGLAIADISFLEIRSTDKSDGNSHVFYTKDANNSTNDYGSVRIFLSSSPDPSVNPDGRFRMVHEDVTQSTLLSQQNSISYSLIAQSAYSSDAGTGMAISIPVDEVRFTGDAIYTEVFSDSVSSIIPACVWNKLPNQSMSHYHVYEGTIYIQFNNEDTSMLYAGRYVDEVFIHVVEET